MPDLELTAVLETLPRPGRLIVTTAAGEHWQTIGIPTWRDDVPDTTDAVDQLRAAGYEPAGLGVHGWRHATRGYALEIRRR